MQIKNLVQLTVDMINKDDEIIRIINLYVSQIEAREAKTAFLQRLRDQLNKALEVESE